jgi:hypothetical protein
MELLLGHIATILQNITRYLIIMKYYIIIDHPIGHGDYPLVITMMTD